MLIRQLRPESYRRTQKRRHSCAGVFVVSVLIGPVGLDEQLDGLDAHVQGGG